ncbi:hypothetical protein MLD38_037675 [Melastoma candidum]|uniref:Uncharacterized protein n=1 Tax=Melastoma candidum TaxID=119954 RepID=A0ACB9LNE0_9MYRT|nr:hypothetical protein MLD38_037675 [Melastoma candidum]
MKFLDSNFFMEGEERYRRCVVTLLIFILASLGAVSFASCIAAEINRAEKGDMKIDGKFCYLPRSGAYKYGITALACITGAQLIGGAIFCGNFCSRKKKRGILSRILNQIKILLYGLSWISFGCVVVLLGTATSMNGEQPYGEGWLDGECYFAKKQVYIVSAILILISSTSTLSAMVLTMSGILRR